MKSLSIKTTMIGIFSSIALACCVLSWTAWTSFSSLNDSANDIADNWLPSVDTARQLEAQVLNLRIAYLSHMTSRDEASQTVAEEKITAEHKAVDAIIDAYRPLISSDNERQLLTEIEAGVDTYSELGKATVRASNAHDMNAALEAIAKQRQEVQSVMQLIQDLVKANVEGSKASSQKGDRVYEHGKTTVLIVLGVVALIVFGAACFAIFRLVLPITNLTSLMGVLAKGNTDIKVPFANRTDELGAMAGAVEVFREAAIANRALEEQAIANRAAAEAERIRVQAEAERAADERLRQATSGLATGLNRLSNGDLAFQISEPFAPEFESLRHDLNTAVARLSEALADVATATNTIDGGSREISKSSDDLSKRTEQQAASLEETAAALDQITSNVASSSKRAEEARRAAAEANESARVSGNVVANAVHAMSRIEQSSQQISNIIGVIDEIAFQTNLLALNAGVEAARAGDAGKGFAVVAQEVRELAQRSAQAAKEIKSLISNSAVEVETGVKLVSQTGTSLKDIEKHVVLINEHMDAIASSAKEQSMGLAEVNSAVNSMDQVTQQNAAMVEETNAASAGLATESARLKGLVGKFKLADSWRHHGPKVVDTSESPRHVASPARQLGQRLSKAFGGTRTAAAEDVWEEF